VGLKLCAAQHAVEISDEWESGRTYLTFKTN